MGSQSPSAYFKRTSLFWMVAVTATFGCFTVVIFWPQNIPYKHLGVIGSFLEYQVNNYYPYLYAGYRFAWFLHVLEALYSIKLCSDKRITSSSARLKWLVQTFLFGFASLQLLISYMPQQHSKSK
ncbi:transmembrane protein 254 [Callorhinchus milii]|uniref:Transmembrane protein 254 n=1 Tax=Callorhinchus milii TaxID=7868 RepID=V9KYK5_CALMI|nr:transmembrane protein 254 [Callorhinchus milii]|eukprot:gi/632937134/ref/XP_007897415.1/ PREDICTED: transmembrane protein 254 [Callorhinchus milii]